jgi:glycine cleavage system H protein
MSANSHPRFPVIPDQENRCIWMDLGVVTFKICDRGYQCEDCPLDIGLRGRHLDSAVLRGGELQLAEAGETHDRSFPLSQQLRQSLLKRMLGPYFEWDRFYHPRHTWVRVISKDEYLIGIDSALATVLGTIDEIQLPAPGAHLKTGHALCEIRQLDRSFSVSSPISGEVVHVNHELSDHPPRLLSDPTKGGWICAARPDLPESDLKSCAAGIHALSWFVQELLRIEQIVAGGVERNKTPLSGTLNDGGEICLNLEALLQKEDYLELIQSLINGTV